MANKLFKDLNVNNDVRRNGFDLSHNVKFTASAGELLPVFHRTIMPGDNFKIRVSHFTRTKAVQTAAMTQIREYFDFFFVPYRLLWKNAPNVLAQVTENPVIATSISSNQSIGTQLPQFSSEWLYKGTAQSDSPSPLLILAGKNNDFAIPRHLGALKLLSYLGFPYITQEYVENTLISSENPNIQDGVPSYLPPASAFPLMAYNKIYYDFYRNSAWEDNQPYNYNADYVSSDATLVFPNANSSYWDSPTMFDLRYSNYPKDLFFGLLPESQYGDEAVVEVNSNDPLANELDLRDLDTGSKVTVGSAKDSLENQFYIKSRTGKDMSALDRLGVQLGQLKQNISILDLRKAQFLQKYREIVGSGARDYQNIIKKIFGVDVPDSLADHCIYLGGNSSDINISEVVNTNLADDNQADIKGKGVGNGNSDMIDFTAQEHGIIMCIYHAQPVVDYQLTAWHFDLTKTEVDDFANPVFDKLGYQELPYYYFNTDFSDASNAFIPQGHLGYTARYFDYKTSIDQVLGGWRSQELQTWISPVKTDYILSYVNQNNGIFDINASFFKVDPSILDTIFAVNYNGTVEHDQLQISSTFEINAVRNLDYLGLPY